MRKTSNELAKSNDIIVLGTFIRQLRIVTESRLGHSVHLALATHPNLPSLSEDMVEEAFSLAQLTPLRSYKVWYPDRLVYQPVAGLAECGFGVCQDWTDIDKCEREDKEMLWRQILAISFTNNSLIVTNVGTSGPHKTEEREATVYGDLGLLEWEGKNDDGSFWTRVVNAIKAVNVSLQTPDLLLLLGEAATHESFRQAVVRALNEMDLSHLYEG